MPRTKAPRSGAGAGAGSNAASDGGDAAPTSKGGAKRFFCTVPGCGKSFSFKANMRRHEGTHTGDKPFACKQPGCGRRFMRKDDLKTHSRVHTGEKPYACSKCGQMFARSSDRRSHERTHDNSGFTCPVDGCAQRISRSYDLRKHLQRHRGDPQAIAALENLTKKRAADKASPEQATSPERSTPLKSEYSRPTGSSSHKTPPGKKKQRVSGRGPQLPGATQSAPKSSPIPGSSPHAHASANSTPAVATAAPIGMHVHAVKAPGAGVAYSSPASTTPGVRVQASIPIARSPSTFGTGSRPSLHQGPAAISAPSFGSVPLSEITGYYAGQHPGGTPIAQVEIPQVPDTGHALRLSHAERFPVAPVYRSGATAAVATTVAALTTTAVAATPCGPGAAGVLPLSTHDDAQAASALLRVSSHPFVDRAMAPSSGRVLPATPASAVPSTGGEASFSINVGDLSGLGLSQTSGLSDFVAERLHANATYGGMQEGLAQIAPASMHVYASDPRAVMNTTSTLAANSGIMSVGIAGIAGAGVGAGASGAGAGMASAETRAEGDVSGPQIPAAQNTLHPAQAPHQQVARQQVHGVSTRTQPPVSLFPVIGKTPHSLSPSTPHHPDHCPVLARSVASARLPDPTHTAIRGGGEASVGSASSPSETPITSLLHRTEERMGLRCNDAAVSMPSACTEVPRAPQGLAPVSCPSGKQVDHREWLSPGLDAPPTPLTSASEPRLVTPSTTDGRALEVSSAARPPVHGVLTHDFGGKPGAGADCTSTSQQVECRVRGITAASSLANATRPSGESCSNNRQFEGSVSSLVRPQTSFVGGCAEPEPEPDAAPTSAQVLVSDPDMPLGGIEASLPSDDVLLV